MPTVAEFLSARRQELIERWVAAANAASTPTVSRVELMDQMPRFVDQLIATLAPGRSPPEADKTATAEEHGVQRLRLGFDIGEVVREYDLLHQAIFDLADEAQVAIDTRSARLLASHINKGTCDAVTQYHWERDAELQRQSGEHLGFIAHELRNPLSSAVMAYGLVQRTQAAPSKALATLGRSLTRLTQTIDGALAHARLKVGAPLRKERVELRALIDDIVSDLSGETEEKGTSIAVDAQAVVTEADPRLLSSAISNLLRNAVKFSHPGATIKVRAARKDDRLRIEVEDECGGLPEGKNEDLFDPFVQKSANRTGFGLGLAITRQAVESHNGMVAVRNLPGRGCVFSIDLPAG